MPWSREWAARLTDTMNPDRRGVVLGLGSVAAAGFQDPRPVAPAVIEERVTFTSRGRPIRAALFRPAAECRGAGVVYLHGSGSIGPNQLRFARSFAANGYMSLAATYLDAAADDTKRGAPIMNAWRECGIDAVEWLIAQGIPPQRTALIGYSLGSFIAVDGALGGGRAAATIGVAGGWDVYPPRAPQRRIPVLIVRAQRDTHVRPSSTERWRQYLVDRDIPVTERVVNGAPHIMSARQWEQVSGYALEFLNPRIGQAEAA